MPSPFIQPLLDEFTRESASTRTLLAASPTAQLDFQPHHKSMSLGALNRHIAMVPRHICDMLANDSFDFANMKSPPIGADTTPKILAAFDQTLDHVNRTLAAYSDPFANATWTARNGQTTIMSLPRLAALRILLLNHTYHHRGQLSVYLRLLDIPVPSVYGPTADINPFA